MRTSYKDLACLERRKIFMVDDPLEPGEPDPGRALGAGGTRRALGTGGTLGAWWSLGTRRALGVPAHLRLVRLASVRRPHDADQAAAADAGVDDAGRGGARGRDRAAAPGAGDAGDQD